MIEALKQAREALATCNSNDGDDPWYDTGKVREAIAAIDAAQVQAAHRHITRLEQHA